MNTPVWILLIFIFLIKIYFVSSDFKDVGKDTKSHFDLIFSVAKFYQVKVILLIKMNYSDFRIITDLIKASSFYFSVIDSNRFHEIELGHGRTMIVCYDYYTNDCECSKTLQNLIKRFHRVIWFVMCTQLPKNFPSFYIPFNYQFILAEENLLNDEFILIEMYKFSPESKLYSSVLGSWSSLNNSLNLTHKSFFERRSNFWKEEVRIVPHASDRTGAASARIPEYEPGIWWAMEKRLNATSREVSETANNYDISININHAHGYQSLPVMMTIKSRLYYKAVTTDAGLLSFFQPFGWKIWLCIVGFIVVSSAGMILVNKCRVFINEYFHYFLLDALYIFLQQGSQITDNRSGFFIIKTVQLFLSFLIFLLYGSILISFITVVVNKPPFTSLEGILENGRYNILAIEGRGRVIFQQSPGIVKKLYVKHVSPVKDSPKTFFQAFHRVCFGNTKLLTECAIKLAPKILSAIPARCHVESVPFTTLKRAFEMQERNQFEEIFRVCITKMLESEAIGNIFWSKALGLATLDTEGSFESIKFSEVSSLFLIFIVTVIFALIIFVIEINTSSHRRNKHLFLQ